MTDSLQERYGRHTICFGCGPSNPDGLHIRSFPSDSNADEVVAEWTPEPKHQAFPGVMNGGIIGALMDCHSNWTAMAYHYRAEGREPGSLPRIDCVTGSLGLNYLKPTPMGVELLLKARVEGEVGRKTRVLCEVWAGDVLTAVSYTHLTLPTTERV